MTLHTPGQALAFHRDTQRTRLPNGLTLLVRRDRSAPVVAIVTHVKVGYFDERDEVGGIAHVLEHMFFKGTPTRGVGAIARETKANGGYLNAHTIYDHTTYYAVLPASSFVQGLEIQFDAYARSIIDADELARELEVIIQEVKRKRDSPSAVAIEGLYALLHDRHRIRRWRIGEESALRAFTQRNLLDFYRTWYQPSNTVLTIVGDVDPDMVTREVAARFGALTDSAVPRMAGPVETGVPGFRVREWAGDIAQHHIAFGWRAPALDHVDSPALELAGVALGTGRASRLYRAVRDQQLASSVAAWHYTAGDVGVFTVHAEAPQAQARAAAQHTWQEVQAARLDGFRASEVLRAQRILEARWLRRLESMDGQATYLAAWEADGGIDRASTYYDRIMSLTARDLHRAVEQYLGAEDVSVVSYRPMSAAPLASDADGVREWLRAVEGRGSRAVLAPTLPTPIDHPVVADTLAPRGRVARPVAERSVVDGVSVYTLHTGVTVLVLPRPGAPLVSVGLFQRGGSLAEASGCEGLARLTAQVMLKGTSSRSGARIAEATEELGSSINVSAGLESLGWSLSVPTRHVGAAIELLADVTQHPVFPLDGLETERALAMADLTRLRDDMYRWPTRLASAAAYGAHPYARTVQGTTESLAGFDTAHLHAFHLEHVVAGASVLAVVGDVDADAIAATIAQTFATLRFRADAVPPMALWPEAAVHAADQREKQQTALAMLFPGPTRSDPDRFCGHVLAAIASGLGGRFFEQLRDKQSLAYTVAAYAVERRAGGVFGAYIATSPEREGEARDGLLREFAKLREAPPTAGEIERARRYLIGAHAIAQQSASGVLGDIVDAWLFGGGLQERNAYVDQIGAVTAADVHQFANRYFDPRRVVHAVVRGRSSPT